MSGTSFMLIRITQAVYHPVDDEDKLGSARASPFVQSLALRLSLSLPYQDDVSGGRSHVHILE